MARNANTYRYAIRNSDRRVGWPNRARELRERSDRAMARYREMAKSARRMQRLGLAPKPKVHTHAGEKTRRLRQRGWAVERVTVNLTG